MKTVKSSALPMRARLLPSGSLSISIGHQDSISQAWVPGGALGLKNIICPKFFLKNIFSNYFYIVIFYKDFSNERNYRVKYLKLKPVRLNAISCERSVSLKDNVVSRAVARTTLQSPLLRRKVGRSKRPIRIFGFGEA